MSGVGISFGADRIYDVLMEANLFPDDIEFNTQILFVNFGEEEQRYCLQLVKLLNAANISAAIFPDQAKMKKQMGYADANKIPFVALVGSQELQDQTVTIKQMNNGNQQCISKSELINFILTHK
jgi:histidyl-tRNA synthetase